MSASRLLRFWNRSFTHRLLCRHPSEAIIQQKESLHENEWNSWSTAVPSSNGTRRALQLQLLWYLPWSSPSRLAERLLNLNYTFKQHLNFISQPSTIEHNIRKMSDIPIGKCHSLVRDHNPRFACCCCALKNRIRTYNVQWRLLWRFYIWLCSLNFARAFHQFLNLFISIKHWIKDGSARAQAEIAFKRIFGWMPQFELLSSH